MKLYFKNNAYRTCLWVIYKEWKRESIINFWILVRRSQWIMELFEFEKYAEGTDWKENQGFILCMLSECQFYIQKEMSKAWAGTCHFWTQGKVKAKGIHTHRHTYTHTQRYIHRHVLTCYTDSSQVRTSDVFGKEEKSTCFCLSSFDMCSQVMCKSNWLFP